MNVFNYKQIYVKYSFASLVLLGLIKKTHFISVTMKTGNREKMWKPNKPKTHGLSQLVLQ